MPQVGDIWEGYQANEFVISDRRMPRAPASRKVTGLSEGEYDTIEQPDGGSTHVHKVSSTKVKFEPLTIERYVDGSPEDKRFQDWLRETFNLSQNVSRRLQRPPERR